VEEKVAEQRQHRDGKLLEGHAAKRAEKTNEHRAHKQDASIDIVEKKR